MDVNKFASKSIEKLSECIIALMPRKYFSDDYTSNMYMLSGDSDFENNSGEYFTCGFSKTIITPENITDGKYFIAGYNSNNAAEAVLDDMYARAVYIDDNTKNGGVIMCSVDCVGLSRKDINEIRKAVIESKKIPGLKSINICATHTHSAVDTQGLWGEKLLKSGRNEAFMKRLHQKTAQMIINAYENRCDGKLYYSVVKTENLQFDCRTPKTFDSNLTHISFEPFDKTKNISIVNFASHAELLGSKTKSVSADFPAYMIKEIEKQNENREVIFLNGAIGGMISAKEIKKVYRNEIDCVEYTKSFGKEIGKIVNSIKDRQEITPRILTKSVSIKVPVSNFVLILARLFNVLNNDISRNKRRDKAYIYSEVGYIELGNEEIGMFLIPGELFPELFNGEFLTSKTSATDTDAEYKVLNRQGNARHKFVVGLCNDELGYIIPENDFFLHPKAPYINSGKDRLGRNHYEETSSTGPKTAEIILNALNEITSDNKRT